MSDETEADWQAGMIEKGYDDMAASLRIEMVRCPRCKRQFRTARAYQDHYNAKHRGPFIDLEYLDGMFDDRDREN